MADRGILFSAPMVLALLAGRKMQTRRLLTKSALLFNGAGWPKGLDLFDMELDTAWVDGGPSPAGNPGPYLKADWPYGRLVEGRESEDAEWLMARLYPRIQPGDRLYVREALGWNKDGDNRFFYRADGADIAQDAIPRGYSIHNTHAPSIHMPRWASRLTLIVTDVRVQRVQDISNADARAEGGTRLDLPDTVVLPASCEANNTYRVGFAHLWNSLHDKLGERWEDNPWIYAVSFNVHHCNIDDLRRQEVSA